MNSDYLNSAAKEEDEAFETLKSLRGALLEQKHINSTLKEQLKHATKIQLKLEEKLNLMEEQLQQQLEKVSVRRPFRQCSGKETCGPNGQTCRLQQYDERIGREIVVISSDDEEPELSHVSLNRKRKNNGASDWEAAGSYVNIVEVQQFHQRDDSADTEFDFHVTENHQLVQIDAQVLSPIDTNYTHQSTQTENHQLVQIDAQVLPNPMDTNYSHQATQTEGELGRKKPQGRSRTLLVSRWNSSVKRVRIVRKKSTPYSCAQWVLSQVGSLVRQHQRFHSGAGEKQFKRSEHKIAFGDIDILTRHQEVHSGENKVDKPFKCPTCHAGFSRNNHLTRHLLIHTNERPFACDICNRSFRRKDSLKSHVNIHTGERPFACEICKRSFQRKYHLRGHMNIHTGERPFACEICNRSFRRKDSLKSHVNIHTGERPFACEICNRSFQRKHHLRDHMNIHIGGKDSRKRRV